MSKQERILAISRKLPGFYAYRPYFVDGELIIQELIFKLKDIQRESEYILTLFVDEDRITEGVIDVKDKDCSIVQISDHYEEFLEIISHKNKIIEALNSIQ
jgi:hypothetical protein